MSQTFDIYSYLASLQGNLSLVQQQIAKNNQSISTASSQEPITYQQLQNAIQVGNRTPNAPSTDQSNLISQLSNSYNSLQTQISSLTSQNTSLSDQENILNTQINAAKQTASSIPRTTNSTVSTPNTSSNLSSLKLPNLTNVSPILLVAGAALLILLLK